MMSPVSRCGIPSSPNNRLLPAVAHSCRSIANRASSLRGGGSTVNKTSQPGNTSRRSLHPPNHQDAASTANSMDAAPSQGDHITAAEANTANTESNSGILSHKDPTLSGRRASCTPREIKKAPPASASGKNW